MKIREFYSIENSVYRVSIRTEDWSEEDLRLMGKFGEPEISLGGIFEQEASEGHAAFSVKIPAEYRRVKTESITGFFDSRDYPDYVKDLANLWGEKMIARIKGAVSALRNNSDDFTREVVHNCNYTQCGENVENNND